MKNYQPYPKKTFFYYQLLLQRYARRLVQDEMIAKNIVREVLKRQYNLYSFSLSEHLRQVLKADVLNYCHYFLQAKIFDRPLIKTPVITYTDEMPGTEGNKNRRLIDFFYE